MKGNYHLNKKILEVGEENCFVSEITVAELKYGIKNSKTPLQVRNLVDVFISRFSVIPIFNSIDIYAKEKAKLRQTGLIIDDFDILIGATAIANNMIMVTNNVGHFNRLGNIEIEDWTSLAPNK